MQNDHSQIVNLSSQTLSEDEKNVLSKGLSYVPTVRYSSFEWVKDIELFVGKLKWARFFWNKELEAIKSMDLEHGDLEGIQTLRGLLEENEMFMESSPFTNLRTKGTKNPRYKIPPKLMSSWNPWKEISRV